MFALWVCINFVPLSLTEFIGACLCGVGYVSCLYVLLLWIILVHTLRFWLCLIVLVMGMVILLILKFINVLVFGLLVNFGFAFMLKRLFVLLGAILIPYSRVCELTRGECINVLVFMIFCGSVLCFVVFGLLVFKVLLCISLVIFLSAILLFPYTRVYGLFRDECAEVFGFMFLS